MIRRFALLLLALPALAQTDGRMQGAYLLRGWSGTNRAHDASGRITTPAVVSNSVTHLGGGEYYFAGGTGSRIEFASPQIITTNSSWTVIAVFNVTNSNASSYQDIFAEVNTADVISSAEFAVFNSRVQLYLRCRVGAGNVALDLNPTNSVTASWHHVAWQCDRTNGVNGATGRIYLNGAQIGVSNVSAFVSITGTLAQAVGMSPRSTPVSTLTGMVSRVLTFSPALSSNEVFADYIKWRATKP